MSKSLAKNKDNKKVGVSMAPDGAGDVNETCHKPFTDTLGGEYSIRDGVMPNAQVVPILWGHYYFNNPSLVTTIIRMVTDLVTGPFMNGLAQYGVSRGSVLGHIVVDTDPAAEPTNLDDGSIWVYLLSWLSDGTIYPTPDPTPPGERNLLYLIFLPPGSTITIAGACGYHKSSHFFPEGFGRRLPDDTFWAVITTAIKTSDTDFVNSVSPCVSHELAEAFTDRDGFWGFRTADCEIGDICEQTFFNYKGWQVEQYYSNWDRACINGDQPVSVKKFLQSIGVDGTKGLRTLRSATINVPFMASKIYESALENPLFR